MRRRSMCHLHGGKKLISSVVSGAVMAVGAVEAAIGRKIGGCLEVSVRQFTKEQL